MSIKETRLALWETAKELSEHWPDLRPEGTDAEPKPFKHLTMGLLLVELGADMVLLAHEVAVSQGAPPPLKDGGCDNHLFGGRRSHAWQHQAIGFYNKRSLP